MKVKARLGLLDCSSETSYLRLLSGISCCQPRLCGISGGLLSSIQIRSVLCSLKIISLLKIVLKTQTGLSLLQCRCKSSRLWLLSSKSSCESWLLSSIGCLTLLSTIKLSCILSCLKIIALLDIILKAETSLSLLES